MSDTPRLVAARRQLDSASREFLLAVGLVLVRSRAEAKIADIEARIRSLRQMSRALARLAHECENENGRECPLLKHLEGEFQ